MKRILSAIMTIIMLASMFCFLLTETSANTLNSTYEEAKDGDLLYELKFGQTSGVYVPTQFHAPTLGDLGGESVVVTDNGRTLAFFKPSLASSASYYGGNIEGLKMGADKKYTITMRISLPPNRGGVFFNFPTGNRKAALTGVSAKGNDNKYHTVIYGFYGRFDPEGDIGSMKGGGRVAGTYKFDVDGYKQFDEIIVEEGRFRDVAILVEGYSYAIFVEGKFLDVISIPEENINGIADDLGFSVYLYHVKKNTPMVVKDVNIYKGDIISANASYPSYAKNYEHYVEEKATTEETTAEAPDVTGCPDIETTVTSTEGSSNTDSEGCASEVTSGLALIALVSLAGVAVKKKRK